MKKTILIVAPIMLAAVAYAGVLLRATPPAPAIDGAATPAYIVVNTARTIRFTTRITDPNVQAGINLLKTDAAGKTLSTIGTLNDAGFNGDLVAGDKTFSLQIAMNESAVGQVYFRISAPFRGVLQRVLSPVIPVTIDPFLLPPDPGEAGKATLQGIDSDNDGLRDDVQRWLGLTYWNMPALTPKLERLARLHLAMTITSSPSRDAIIAIADARHRALNCLAATMNGSQPISSMPQALRDLDKANQALKAVIINTPDRHYAFARANELLSGLSDSMSNPATWLSQCQ